MFFEYGDDLAGELGFCLDSLGKIGGDLGIILGGMFKDLAGQFTFAV